MKRLFALADQYCRESTWKTIAALKCCLLSLGVIIGLLLPGGAKTPVIAVCAVVFVMTYVPLMKRFIGMMQKNGKDKRR